MNAIFLQKASPHVQAQFLLNLPAGVVQVKDGRQGVEACGVELVGVGHDQIAKRRKVLGLFLFRFNGSRRQKKKRRRRRGERQKKSEKLQISAPNTKRRKWIRY